MLQRTSFMSQCRPASWRRESSTGCRNSSLPTGHEYGCARTATPRPSADCQVYNIISIYKCGNNAFNRSLMLRELISGSLIAQLASLQPPRKKTHISTMGAGLLSNPLARGLAFLSWPGGLPLAPLPGSLWKRGRPALSSALATRHLSITQDAPIL